MRKKRIIKKHHQVDDPHFPSPLVKQLITKLMFQGKKFKARKILYQTFECLKKETKEDPLVVFEEAVEKLKPQSETKKIRLGGTHQPIPQEVRPERSLCLALR